MNIGLFTETYYPEINGVAASVFVLKEELEKQGHNVYVFTTTSPNAPKKEKNVYRVRSLPFILMTDRRVGLMYQRRIASAIKKLQLDVIHTHTEFSLGIFGRIMASELKIPIVHTYHTIYEDYTHYIAKGAFLDRRAKKVVRGITRVCCNTVDEVIVPTEKVEKLLRNYHVKREIYVIPTGINLDKFKKENIDVKEVQQIKESLGILESDKVILYLGRVSSEKNIEELIRNMEGYLEERQDVKFVIVGDGPDRARLQKIVGGMTCKDSILFAGEIPYDEVGKYYQIGDVFVSASTSETQGITFIEAMASSLPVVAMEDRCLDGILEEGENGYFFHNKQDFQEALDAILYSENAKDFCRNARECALQHSTKKFAESVLDVYEAVLERSSVEYVR